MKYRTGVKSVQRILICLLDVSISLHTKLAAVAHLAEGQILRATGNWVKFLILRDGTLRLILSIKEGKNLDPRKT